MGNLVLRRKRGERVILRQRSLGIELGTITVVEVEPTYAGGRVKLGFELLADIEVDRPERVAKMASLRRAIDDGRYPTQEAIDGTAERVAGVLASEQ